MNFVRISQVSEERRISIGLTYDDVLLVPKFSKISSRKQVNIETFFSRRIKIRIPIVSSSMDTVTEADMAVEMAKMGGIGVIHRFMTLQQQAEEVRKVKRWSGIRIEDPITLSPSHRVCDAMQVMKRNDIGGIIVVDEEKRVLGLVSRRDIIFEREERKLGEIMTRKAELITASPDISVDDASEILRKHRLEKLPLVDREGKLAGLITAKDIVKRREFPYAAKDAKGRLLVAAAIGVRGDNLERARRLFEEEVDAIVVDVAHGHSVYAIETVRRLKAEYRDDLDVVAGNVATFEGAEALVGAGADGVKVGVGSGSICTTRVIAGVGVPQLTAVMECSRVTRDSGIPVIADGGIRNTGDVTKAIAAGASTVMIGNLLAGTEESPGATVLRKGQKFKLTRGMASIAASVGRRIKEGDSNDVVELFKEVGEDEVAEGVEGLIPYRGRVEEVLRQLVGGLRSGMSYCGAENIHQLWENAEFIRMTEAGLKESYPHDIERLV